MEPTRAGETLRPYAEQILSLADDARAAVAATAARAGAMLTIGALEAIASAKLSRWLSAFRDAHPEIGLRQQVADTDLLSRKLEDGGIDVAFCFDNGDLGQRFVSRAISAEPLIVVRSPDRAFASGSLDLAEFAATPFVATEVGCVFRRMFDDAFAELGLAAPKLAAEVGSIAMIARLAAEGVGMGLVPRFAVADALERGEIVETPWPGSIPTASLIMIWRRRRIQPPALKLLLAAASESCSALRSADARRRHEARSPS
jgi:DNA-binding transcriptional LysR family regulator